MSGTPYPSQASTVDLSLGPLAVCSLDETDSSGSVPWVVRATWAFVALGIWLRISRTLLNYPLWGDESMLAANLIDRGYLELTRPLANRQVCPVLFLWIERAAVELFGFSELTLRLFPMLCGVVGVFLFRHLAARLLSGVPALLAVAVFAVSWWPIRYCGEVKPYATDFLASLSLMSTAVEWWRRPDRVCWLWAMAALGPLALASSFPAAFVAGGVGMALLPAIALERRARAWAAYLCYLLGLVATFGTLLSFQSLPEANRAFFLDYWARAFPPLESPARLATWLVSTHTGYMFAYPEGGERGASALTSLCFAAGVVVLWRRGRRTVLAMVLIPFALGLAAAALRRYPYGMSNRTMQYLAPAICLLTGLGAARLLACVRGPDHRRRTLVGIILALACLGLARDAYSLRYPYRLATEAQVRSFARWFWVEKSREAELICGRTDLGFSFRPGQWDRDHATTYLCLQKIYSPRHARGEPPHLESVSPVRPLRVVFYNEYPEPGKDPRFAAWLAGITIRHEIRKVETFTVTPVDGRPDETTAAFYLVYDFVPKAAGPAVANAAVAPDRR